MTEIFILVIITTSSDFRIHAHGGFFVDVRVGNRNGRQMTTRNPGTHAEALAFVDELRAAGKRSGKNLTFVVDDRVAV